MQVGFAWDPIRTEYFIFKGKQDYGDSKFESLLLSIEGKHNYGRVTGSCDVHTTYMFSGLYTKMDRRTKGSQVNFYVHLM